ncbi:hypothetical protein HPB51_012079 [Rhipicephalus microplus]|uniref:Tick transposon n=1 Tax=Rhipicephalus microplus TaxID=6941 RepID=A0A9J6ETJ8_RHIMP|nr:hypothetical protein HPB51_012079 [Rhipicephalus microplus]
MQGHDCTPKCVICDGEHPTGDSLCKKKLKNVTPPKKLRTDQPKDWVSQPERTGDAKSSEEFPQLRLDKPRWFSSYWMEQRQSRSSSRSRSRSQSRSRSRSRSRRGRQNHTNTAPPAPGKSSLKNQRKHRGPPAEMGSCEESQDALAAGRTNINQNPNYPRVVTLVSKMIAATDEYIGTLQINHQIISLFPQKRGKAKTIIVNLYSPPKDKEEANDYAIKLATEGWVKFCSSLQNTLSTAKTWSILRNILDPDKSKSTTSRTLQKIAETFPGTDDDLVKALKERYIGDSPPSNPANHMRYSGARNEKLDEPITKEEVFAAAQAAKRNTAPGEDQITNAMIRNLSDKAIEGMTKQFNEHYWLKRKVPAE